MIHELQNIIRKIGSYTEIKKYFDSYEVHDESNLKDTMTISSGTIMFKDVSVKFGDKVIFDKFNLTIADNTKMAIMGEIGSGKSSLLKIIIDLIPHDGHLYIDNKDTDEYTHNSIIKNIAYIPQNPKLFNRTILDNLQYGTSFNEQKINEMIQYYGLTELFKTFTDGLNTNVGKNGEKISGGQRQIVYILRSLFQNKKIILLDEPSSSLDGEYKKTLIGLLKKINGKTIIAVTHDTDILEIFDRVLIMNKGQIIKDIKI